MTKLFKNSKQLLACVMAFAVLAVSLFTGVAINADAATVAHGEIDMLEFGNYLINDLGSTSQWYDTKLVDNGETGADWDNAIIIDSAEEFVYLSKQGGGGAETAGKYYKVADGIAGFNLSTNSLDITKSYDDNQAVIEGGGKNHAGVTDGFQGYFDGNGVTIYGATTNKAAVSGSSALFTGVKGDVLIKNINVTLSFFYATNVAAGIVATYTGDPVKGDKLVIENCTVTDSHIEILAGEEGRKVNGGILAFAQNSVSTADGYVNGEIIIKNCLVDLDPKHFVTPESGAHLVKGGFTGNAQTNGIRISDCVSIGIKLYPTYSGGTTAPHSANANNFSNCYTDQTLDEAYAWNNKQNFEGKATKLTKSQMSGASALENMKLDASVWMADDVDVPELRVTHKNTTTVDNGDGTHSEVCACGFGGARVDHNFINEVCACGAKLDCSVRKTIYWDGSVATGIATGSGKKDDPYIIKTAAELAWLVQQTADVTTDKYYEIDNSIGAIVLQSADKVEDIMALDSAADVKAYFENGTFTLWKTTGWEVACFAGYFDGNGATIYGLYAPSANNSALFCTVDGGTAIVNLGVKNSYFTSSADNYQVAVLFGTSSTNSYGAKREGMVWVNNCLIANNYLYNASTQYVRSAIVGNSQDAITIDNTLIYGNDATYGDGVKMPVVGNRTNAILVGTTHHDGFVPIIVKDGDKDLYANAIRNTVVLGADLFNVAEGKNWRKNQPECFVNCFTDGKSGSIEFPDGTVWEYTEEQIKSITAADLATIALPEAFIATDAMPELKSFHDAEFKAVSDATNHMLTCSCGLVVSEGAHVWSEEVNEELGYGYTCTECGYVCDCWDLEQWSEAEIIDPTCTEDGKIIYKCDNCGWVDTENPETGDDALGHTFVTVSGTPPTCTSEGVREHNHCIRCELNFDLVSPSNPIDVVIPKEPHEAATDANGTIYACDDDYHWTYCKDCGVEEVIEKSAHNSDSWNIDGANGHQGTCSVCELEQAEIVPHVFGDDNVCDACEWTCASHAYEDGETITPDWEDITADYCYKVEQICAICGTKGEDKVIAHATGDWEEIPYFDENYVDSCVSDGQHTEVKVCQECFFQVESKIVTDPKSGHSFEEYEAEAPTCSTTGCIAFKECVNCGNSFALDAAEDEAYENALSYEDLEIPVDETNHNWVELGEDATCDEEGIVEHKYCLDCFAIAIGDETVDVTIDWDAYYECDDEGNPVGVGAILEDGYNKWENETFKEFVEKYYPDAGVEIPAYPEDDSDWDAMMAYYEEYDAVFFALYEIDENIYDAWYEYYSPLWEAIQFETRYNYVVEAAVAAGADFVIEATGHELTKVDEVAATYDKEGTKAHYVCECGKLYLDAEGKEEVTAADLVIAKLVKEDAPVEKPEGDNSDKSPATGESVASVAAVAALMGAAFVLVRKSKKA